MNTVLEIPMNRAENPLKTLQLPTIPKKARRSKEVFKLTFLERTFEYNPLSFYINNLTNWNTFTHIQDVHLL